MYLKRKDKKCDRCNRPAPYFIPVRKDHWDQWWCENCIDAYLLETENPIIEDIKDG